MAIELPEGTVDSRGEYLHAIEMARSLHDPAVGWEGFRDTLWEFLIRVFGLEESGSWPSDVPNPAGQIEGDAVAVAAWMRERMGEDHGSSDRPSSR